MKRKDMERFKGSRLKLLTITGRIYHGKIRTFFEDEFELTDKFDQCVVIRYSQIAIIEEITWANSKPGGGSNGK